MLLLLLDFMTRQLDWNQFVLVVLLAHTHPRPDEDFFSHLTICARVGFRSKT